MAQKHVNLSDTMAGKHISQSLEEVMLMPGRSHTCTQYYKKHSKTLFSAKAMHWLKQLNFERPRKNILSPRQAYYKYLLEAFA